MSTSSKGAGLERRAIAILEAQGWTVYRAGKVLMRIPPRDGGPARTISKQHDIFGAYDLIAKKAGEPTRWIQVSTLHLMAIQQVGREQRGREAAE